ncbi:MAG: IPT/TIG domain-containing protein [Candidatus Dormibacteria bacterium]
MKNRLAASAALLLVLAGGLLWVAAAPAPGRALLAQRSARTQSLQRMAAGPSLGHRISCVDLPISSALIQPDSCWETGSTSMLVAGQAPSQPTRGAVAIIRGQARQLATLAGSGALRVTEVGQGTACVEDAHGRYHAVSLGLGTITTAGSTSCSLGRPSQAGSATPAQLASNSVPLTSNQAQAGIPPPVTPSYYEYYAYLGQCPPGSTSACPLYQQGQATTTPSSAGLVVLDFGAPCSTLSTPAQYGTQLFEGSACTPDSSLQQLVQEWIDGYESDHGAGTVAITLAIGTSNSENAIDPSPSYGPASLQLSAQGWYQLVSGAYSIPGSAPIVRWGGSDIEQASSGWWDSSNSVAWAQYYSQAAGFTTAQPCSLAARSFLADYGDDIVGGSGTQDGWTAANVYSVSQGTPGTCAVPEIYYTSMASEWSALSAAFATAPATNGINFTAVMVEAVSGTLTATQAWTTLQGQTNQSPPISALTQVAPYGDFQVQGQPPQVTAVTPLYGPRTGGTTVTITGADFYSVAQVYFGQVAAQSFTLESTGTISAVAPAGLASTVDVVVETSLGSSSTSPADQFLYTPPPCTAVSVTLGEAQATPGVVDPVSPQATCPSGAVPNYAYFTGTSANGPWTLRQSWTTSAWSWSTAGLSPGDYYVLVWASDGPTQLSGVQPTVQVQTVSELTLQPPPNCDFVAVATSPSAVAVGTNVTVAASASCPLGSVAKYSYFTRAGSSGGWALRAAWIGASWTWPTAGLAAGSYQVLVWASDGPYTVPQSQAIATVTVGSQTSAPAGACTAVAVNAPGSAAAGSPLTVTATATCPTGTVPEYSYFTRAGTSGSWTLRAAWIGPNWSWPTSGLPAGTYQVLVWASDGPFTVPQAQQAESVELTSGSACTGVQVSLPATVAAGSPLTASASSTCPSGSTAEYSYFTRAGTSGGWTLQAAWIGPSWGWSTSSLTSGVYQVLVWVSDGPFTVPQAQSAATVEVTGEASCTAVSVAASPSNVAVGQAVGVKAAATCPPGAAPEYSYFIGRSGSGPWTLEEAWIGGSWTLATRGMPSGLYYVLAWASDGPYTVPQVQSATSFELGGPGACSAVTVSASPPSASVGSQVGVTASATCPGGASPEYSYFEGSSQAGPWTLEAAWIGGTWTWPTAGRAPGTYYVLAWASDGPYTVPQVQSVTPVSVS